VKKSLLSFVLATIGLFTVGRTACAADDPQAMLDKAASKLQSIHALSADYTLLLSVPLPGQLTGNGSQVLNAGSVVLMRPNFSHLSGSISERDTPSGAWKKDIPQPIVKASDGKIFWRISPINQYERADSDPQGKDFSVLAPITDFFDPAKSIAAQVRGLKTAQQMKWLKYAGVEKWDGASYQVVAWECVLANPNIPVEILAKAPNGVVTSTVRCYIGSDGLVHRETNVLNAGSYTESFDQEIHNLKVNPKLTQKDFAFKLPPGATPETPPASAVFLANGTVAPEFRVQDKDGNIVRLSSFKGKVVVLDFWATWCGPCQEMLPETAQVAEEFSDKGVVVLGINVWDTREAFLNWLPQHAQYKAMQFTIDPTPNYQDGVAMGLYNVTGIPSQYVIDANGKVADSFVMGTKETLESAVTKALGRQ
jgi:thiol-disulfide isomerase/thioredoxin